MDVPNVRLNKFSRNNRLAYLGFKSCMCDYRISSDQVDREIGKVLRLVGQKYCSALHGIETCLRTSMTLFLLAKRYPIWSDLTFGVSRFDQLKMAGHRSVKSPKIAYIHVIQPITTSILPALLRGR